MEADRAGRGFEHLLDAGNRLLEDGRGLRGGVWGEADLSRGVIVGHLLQAVEEVVPAEPAPPQQLAGDRHLLPGGCDHQSFVRAVRERAGRSADHFAEVATDDLLSGFSKQLGKTAGHANTVVLLGRVMEQD